MTTGVLLINLGTPDQPTTPAVRRYLRTFLMDGRVLDIPWMSRAALVNLIIAPFRAPKSAHAYQKIWTEQGSPLLVHSQALAAGVAERLGSDVPVALGMRYGNPSLQSALAQLADCEQIIAVPLYPQYASASTGTALEALYQLAKTDLVVPHLLTVPPFYEHPAFVEAAAEITASHLEPGDFVLFSYHGIPKRQLPCTPCEDTVECEPPAGNTASCYRAQAYATTRALAKALNLAPDQYTTSFQSRLGRIPWIKPYTDVLIEELVRERGIKRMVVVCPSFVSDCLETLEEIGIQLHEQFEAAGGERFVQVPCVNAAPSWVDGVVRLIQEVGGI